MDPRYPDRSAFLPPTGLDTGPRPAPFDTWLNQELTRVYSATLHETVPNELLEILNKAFSH
jgi:hypothetical protein